MKAVRGPGTEAFGRTRGTGTIPALRGNVTPEGPSYLCGIPSGIGLLYTPRRDQKEIIRCRGTLHGRGGPDIRERKRQPAVGTRSSATRHGMTPWLPGWRSVFRPLGSASGSTIRISGDADSCSARSRTRCHIAPTWYSSGRSRPQNHATGRRVELRLEPGTSDFPLHG